MFEAISTAAVTALCNAGINAVKKYPSDYMSDTGETVCVSLSPVKLSSAGIGNYIGLGFEGFAPRELYGKKAQYTLCLEIFSDTADLGGIQKSIHMALSGIEVLTITGFETGDTVFDRETGMFRCMCKASGKALLILDKREPVFVEPEEDE